MESLKNLPPSNYLVILVIMQIAMLIFSLLGKFNSGIFFIFIRVIFLIMAQCCKQPSSAAFYAVLALMNGLYSFDPVGLFVTGHGDLRTLSQNICCIIACGLAFFASYLGYLYKISLERQYGEGQNGGGFGLGGYGGNSENPAYFNNGNNIQYGNQPSRYGGQNNPYSGGDRNNFQPFQGQGYAL